MVELGVQGVVLSSVFKDEVVDFMMVNASLGSNDSIKELLTKLKAKGTFKNYFIYLKNKFYGFAMTDLV